MAAETASAGAWSQNPREGIVISTTDYTTAAERFDDNGKLSGALNFEKTEQRIYGEIGLAPQWTLVGQASFQDVILFDGAEKFRYIGPGVLRTGLRRELTESGPERWALQADVGYTRGGEFVADGDLTYERMTSNFRVLYGRGWERAYLDVQAGYELRFGDVPDTWELDVSAGYDIDERFSLAGAVYGRSTDSGRIDADVIGASDSVKIKGSALFRWRGTTYEIGAIGTVAGKNHVRDRGVTVAIWRKF